jgi:hypothetical protein
MTHDPNEKLCQFVEMDERDYILNCAFYAPPDCQCGLIAKVREDTIAAAVQRVQQFEYVSTIGVALATVVPKAAVITAIKGDQP